MSYQQSIREILARTGNVGVNSRHVEASMRCEHGTLDGLSKSDFRQSVLDSIDEIQEMGSDMASRLAESLGL